MHRLLLIALSSALSLAHLSAQAANELANPGFEEVTADKPAAWKPYGRGCTVDRQTRHGGQAAICCTSSGAEEMHGVTQVLRYEKPDRRPIIIGGWSKAEGVGAGGDYSLFLDVIYDDDTPWWAKTCPWSRGTHDWQYASQVFWPKKPVREIRAYLLLRRTSGKAWFDDVFLARDGLHVIQPRAMPDFPRTVNGLRVRAQLTLDAAWRCALLDAAGEEIDACTGSGRSVAWDCSGDAARSPSHWKLTAEAPHQSPAAISLPVAAPPARPANPVRKAYALWWETAMRKVLPTDFPPAERSAEIAVSLAQNEREGFQLAITPADDQSLRAVQVECGALLNERGQPFPAEGVEPHLVGYVYVEVPAVHPDAPQQPGWRPDPLLPLRPFDVPGGRTQTVWINFHATPAVPPGTYRGDVVVRAANAPETRLPIRLRVYGFALPRAPRMKTAFALMDGYVRAAYGEITPELRRRLLDLMLEHRLNPDDISRTEPPAIADVLYARQRGLTAFNIANLVPLPKNNPLWVCYSEKNAYPADFVQTFIARVDPYVQELRKQGLSKLAYFYGFDERGPEYDELIRGICRQLKQRYPEVNTFTTAGYMYESRRAAPATDQDYMDWYCPLTPKYDRELSARLRAQGKQVWWYVCCGPRYPYANFAAIDYPTIEGRLLGWMTYGYEADGLLYWHVNQWHPNPIIEGSDPYLAWNTRDVWGMVGDGCLTYPLRAGPVSSIRLEAVRDGVEDFDYLALLADREGRPAAEAFVAQLVTSLTEFSRDPAALTRVRQAIAERLEATEKRP